jgi:translocation protein SEC63
MLTKAYECLTDETMIEKCKKYGNPDGNSAFHVGIALPSFLLKKENRTAFLAVIFLILLVIVPVFVLNALGSIGKFDDNGV